MKKILMLLFIGIFFISFASAFEFDNTLTYSKENKVVLIENLFGLPLIGTDIAKIEIISHKDLSKPVYAIPNQYNRVIIQKINGMEDYNNFIGEPTFLNKDTNKYEELDYFWQKAIYGLVDVNDYKQVCSLINNFSSCKNVLIGSHKENQIISWENFTEFNINKDENLTIALSVWVNENDWYDGIPVFFGKKISAWAEWDSGLDNGLLSYWKLNNDFLDFLENNDGTNSGTTDIAGIIGRGRDFEESEDDYIDVGAGALAFTDGPMSINMWVKPETITSDRAMFEGDENFAYSFHIQSGTKLGFGRVGTSDVVGADVLGTGSWVMITVTYDGSADEVVFYMNGSADSGGAKSFSATFVASSAYRIGNGKQASHAWDGGIDEVGIWNRVLSQAEVTQLYNGGIGITPIIPSDPLVIVNITFPTASSFNSVTQDLNYTASVDIGSLDSCWYSLDLGQTNATRVDCGTNFTSLTANEGSNTWTVYANDTTGEFSNDTVTFTVDTINPTISVTAPSGQITSHVFGNNLTLNWNANDTNLQSCWFDYNDENTTVTCGDGTTNVLVPVVNKQSLIMWANDTAGRVAFDTTSWTYAFIENNATFNSTTQETASETFVLNLSTDLNVLSISSVFNYNGTESSSTASCVGGDCLLTNTIDISLVESAESEIHKFFWNFTIFNGTDSVETISSTREQNVSRIHLGQCNVTLTTKTLNFTTYDEQNLSIISPFQFDGTFSFWTGGGSIFRNNSFSINDTEINLCLNPNVTMKIDSTINYDEVGNLTQYTDRFYYFDDYPINNVRQDISMYLLKSTSSTSFILKVQDENLLPVTDALIEIHRFYPGEGVFKIVQIARTDDNGKSVGFFETETVDYKFVIKKAGKILLTTGQQKVIPETSPFTLTFNIGVDLGEPWASQNDIPSLNSSLTWDKDTGIITYVYVDSSDNFTQSRLFVQQQSFTNSSAYTTICNENSTLSSATITCNVGDTDGFYIASAFITRGSEALDKQISFQIEGFSSIVGSLGLFLGFFLILIASFMFKFNEVAGIWATTITILLVNLMGLIKFGAVFVTAIIGIAIILTWVMEK